MNGLTAMILGISMVASAEDGSRRFGIGGGTTLDGTQGLHLSWRWSPDWLLDATLGGFWGLTDPYGGASMSTTYENGLAVHAFRRIIARDKAELFAGMGFNIAHASSLEWESGHFALEFPLRPTLRIGDSFALFTQMGLVIDVMQPRPKGGLAAFYRDDDLRLELHGSLLGAAGVDFLF